MPKKMHDRLIKAASKKGLTGERRRAYIYGPLQKARKAQLASTRKSR